MRMLLYDKLYEDEDFIEFFCQVLESHISEKNSHQVHIGFKRNSDCIYFFIDGSSILQILPDKDLQYTYAHVPSYEDEIRNTFQIIEKQFHREKKIEQIIKKENL